MKGKTITLLVAACFILLSFSPMSSNAEENLQSVLVEVNGEKYPVELSEEDLETIDEIVASLQNQLQDVTTKEQATQLLQDALTELDNLGVLQGISVEQLTQQIMRGVLLANNENSIFQNQPSKNDSTIDAMCSLITGLFSVSSSDSSFAAASPIMRASLIILALITAPFVWSYVGLYHLWSEFIELHDIEDIAFIQQLDEFLDKVEEIMGMIFFGPLLFSLTTSIIKIGLLFPLLNPHIISTMTFGYSMSGSNYHNFYYPSGIITSIGLSIQTINGEFIGGLPIIYDSWGPGSNQDHHYSGIYGFTGISLNIGSNYFIIGSGLRTRLVEF